MWINKAPTGNNVILTDVRFPNEASYVTDNGGILVKIERENQTMNQYNAHESEKYVDIIECNYTIKTKGTSLSELKDKVYQFVNEVKV